MPETGFWAFKYFFGLVFVLCLKTLKFKRGFISITAMWNKDHSNSLYDWEEMVEVKTVRKKHVLC